MLQLSDGLPARRFPVVNILLIVANFAVFILYELPNMNSAVYHASFYPCTVDNACRGPEPWGESWITAMFLHGGWDQILGNMLFLAIFGPTIEDSMTRVRFLAFYLLGGLIALGAQVLVGPDSTGPTLGASGAIAAVLGGYVLLYPRARILSLVFIVFFVTIIEVPAVFLLGFWFLEQLYFGAAGLASPVGGGEGVAYFAHIGGFAFGLLLIRLFARRRRPEPPALPVY